MDFSKFTGKTKIERNKERAEKSRTTTVKLTPRSPTEHSIQELMNEAHKVWRGRSINETVNIILNARMMRHDVWVDFLNETMINRKNVVGDVNVEEFCKDRLGITGLIPPKIGNKTPDILILDEVGNFVICGDITCTINPRAAGVRKYTKYMDVCKFIEKNGFQVKVMNLIIKCDGSNAAQEINAFIEMDLIMNMPNSTVKAVEYTRLASKVMTDAELSCIDKSLLQDELDKIDKTEEDIDIGTVIPDSLINDVDITPDEIHMSELEIIEILKNHTNTIMTTNPYNSDISDINLSFQKIIDKNKEKEFTSAKSVLKVCDNSYQIEANVDHDLVADYLSDILNCSEDPVLSGYVQSLLPSFRQLDTMKLYNKANSEKNKQYKVYGKYQYSRPIVDNLLTNDLANKLKKGKKIVNEKTTPKTINPDNYIVSKNIVEAQIKYFGSTSLKPSFLDDTWDAKTNFEMLNTEEDRQIYEYVKNTNGAQLTNSLSNLYHRITHLKTSLSVRDNIYIPPNGSFIAIIPKEHAPVSSKRCDLPFIFMTRYTKDQDIGHIEYEHKIETNLYTYFISKLCRLDVDKIEHWDQAGYKLVASCTYLLSEAKELMKQKERLIGIMTLFLLDSHQKTSEYLDLLKYIAYMPFSDVNNLPDLIMDKFDLIIKTNLDVWCLLELQDFINKLSNFDKSHAIKPKIKTFNTRILPESLGLTMHIPSFFCNDVFHLKIETFIEEISMAFTIRPKHLYGNQFMDKSISLTAEWNGDYEKEIIEHGGWATTGYNKNKQFPFEAKFCYSRDAIYYAQKYSETLNKANKNKVMRKIAATKFDKFMHKNTSLRGCVKDASKRKNKEDYHSTSLNECLDYYKRIEYDQSKATAIECSRPVVDGSKPMEYSMSGKPQRGSGRPIATPDLHTKAALMLIEKPEQAIGELIDNNIVVPGKNKLQKQCEAYKSLLSEAVTCKYKQVYQLTEDQTKFSENDNTRKYYNYIKNNRYLDIRVRKVQLKSIKRITNREHLVHRIPERITNDPDLSKHINNDATGVRTNIGWPQGMLNFISTSIHSIADYWITYAYNLAYPEETVLTYGLVHSDDSWCAIACNTLFDFKRFCVFRTEAKKMFCLKLNKKKLWGSRYLGELVSNYNINGNVHFSVAKIVANSFGNVNYQNWVSDVHSLVSNIQQAYRSGAKIKTLILLSTILRQHLTKSYQVSGLQKELMLSLPVEMGGYPNNSVFELGTSGLRSHYHTIYYQVKMSPVSDVSKMILKALKLSLTSNNSTETEEVIDDKVTNIITRNGTVNVQLVNQEETNDINLTNGLKFKDIDYEKVIIPSRGEVFSSIKHIMPKSKKIAETVKSIKSLPFASEGIEMIIPDPKELTESLGNLKKQSNSIIYSLAADKYTSSIKRMAISQAIQSSGKVVKIGNLNPMTINEMLTFLRECETIIPCSPDLLYNAMIDETGISDVSRLIVHNSDYVVSNNDKRRVVNKQPEIESNFTTICNFRNVLLFIIDRDMNTDLLRKHGTSIESYTMLENDARLVRKRFSPFFSFYSTKDTCNLIMQMYIQTFKTRYWMQPSIKSQNITTFMCDLYGKTINDKVNYSVSIEYSKVRAHLSQHENIIDSIYTVTTLNSIYEGKFAINNIKGQSIQNVINDIDYRCLTQDLLLKYSVLQFVYNNNSEYLKYYDSKKVYDQVYLKPQVYVNGEWTGSFICLVKFGNTIVKIEGEPSNLKIESSSLDTNEITMAMMNFVNKNFPIYKYKQPGNWGNIVFWDCKMQISRQFLNNYPGGITLIGTTKAACSVPFVFNRNLTMPITFNNITADRYEVDEGFRHIYKVIDDQKIKLDYVKQNLSCPLAKDINLDEEILEGFSNNELLHTKIIIYLTTRRYYHCSRLSIEQLFEKRYKRINSWAIFNFWYYMMVTYFKYDGKVDHNLLNNREQEEVETITYEIQGKPLSELLHIAETTTPESLESIEVDYIIENDSDRLGSIYKHNEITKTLAKIYLNGLTNNIIEDVIYLIIKDKLIRKELINDCNSTVEEQQLKIDELLDNIEDFEISLDTYAFIISSGLNTEEGWLDLNLKKIIEAKQRLITSKESYRIKDELYVNLLDICYDKIPVSSDDEDLLEIMK